MPAAAASASAPPSPLGRRPAMPAKRYVVTLTSAEREQLEALVRPGRRPDRSITRARILLLTNQFMLFQPLLGWRYVMPTEQRRAVDFAEVLRWLAEEFYPDAERLVLVTGSLSTHTPACLYEAFDSAR